MRLGYALAALVVAIALVLVARRLAGALERPLPVAALTVLAIFLAASWLTARRLAAAESGRLARAAAWAPAAAWLAIAAAVCLAGTPLAGLLAIWLVPPAAQCLDRPWLASRLVYQRPTASTPAGGGETLEQMTRRRLPSGGLLVEGWLKVRFAEGQRTATAHLAFCPPFERVPEFEVDAPEAPGTSVKLGQLLPYGARLELKIPQAGPANVTIAFRAAEPVANAQELLAANGEPG